MKRSASTDANSVPHGLSEKTYSFAFSFRSFYRTWATLVPVAPVTLAWGAKARILNLSLSGNCMRRFYLQSEV